MTGYRYCLYSRESFGSAQQRVMVEVTEDRMAHKRMECWLHFLTEACLLSFGGAKAGERCTQRVFIPLPDLTQDALLRGFERGYNLALRGGAATVLVRDPTSWIRESLHYKMLPDDSRDE